MQLVPLEEFLSWAARSGIDTSFIDSADEPAEDREDETEADEEDTAREDPPVRRFQFTAPEAASRYWLEPLDEAAFRWVTAFFDLIEPWDYCWAVKRQGAWDDVGSEEGLSEVLRGVGIPPGWEGAVRFERSERGLLSFVLLAIMTFDWCGYYNTLVIPDHARVMLETDDDDIAPVSFAGPDELHRFVTGMEARGFPLPSRPPGYGFYWQDWMGPKPADWDEDE